MAETEECAQRACFRMADVTVIHSVVIKATGSTATETLVLELEAMLNSFDRGICKLGPPEFVVEKDSRPRIEDSGESTDVVGAWGSATWASLRILQAA